MALLGTTRLLVMKQNFWPIRFSELKYILLISRNLSSSRWVLIELHFKRDYQLCLLRIGPIRIYHLTFYHNLWLHTMTAFKSKVLVQLKRKLIFPSHMLIQDHTVIVFVDNVHPTCYMGHNCLEELVGPMNCSRYMAGTLVKSTLKLTSIHGTLNDLSMAFFLNDPFVVFLC